MVCLRGPINTYDKLGYTILYQSQSTCLNTNYELGYFELITGETCQHECEELINCVKANQIHFCGSLFILNTNFQKIYFIRVACTNHVNHCQPLIQHDRTH